MILFLRNSHVLNQTFDRALTQTQETFENSPDCGKPIESKSRKVIRKLEEDECLSSCTWKVNPFFKTLPNGDLAHYGAKWWEPEFTEENTFPQLHSQFVLPDDQPVVRLDAATAFNLLGTREQLYSHYLSRASW